MDRLNDTLECQHHIHNTPILNVLCLPSLVIESPHFVVEDTLVTIVDVDDTLADYQS